MLLSIKNHNQVTCHKHADYNACFLPRDAMHARLRGTSHGDEMMRLGVDICGLSDVRWNGQGHFTTLDGHTIVYSGRLTQGMSGVAVWIHRKIAGALVGHEPISD